MARKLVILPASHQALLQAPHDQFTRELNTNEHQFAHAGLPLDPRLAHVVAHKLVYPLKHDLPIVSTQIQDAFVPQQPGDLILPWGERA